MRRKKSKKKKELSIFKGIVVFAIVSFFTWLLVGGLLEVFKIDASPWIKITVGLIGLFIAGLIGWKKF